MRKERAPSGRFEPDLALKHGGVDLKSQKFLASGKVKTRRVEDLRPRRKVQEAVPTIDDAPGNRTRFPRGGPVGDDGDSIEGRWESGHDGER